jgi:hypothetical protein
MKNIHILPTDKPSRLYLGNNGNFVFGMMQTSIQSRNDDFTNQNTHITSNKDINENDYIITKDGRLVQVSYLLSKDLDGASKVILTTDQSLDGVQAIDDEFLKWFVNNSNCEYIEVEEVYFHGTGYYKVSELSEQDKEKYSFMKKYKIIIPKEEPKQRLEKYSERFDNKDNELVEGVFNPENWGKRLVKEDADKDSFEDVTKYKKERSYSEEDVKNAFLDGWQLRDGDLPFPKAKNKWFKELKNK